VSEERQGVKSENLSWWPQEAGRWRGWIDDAHQSSVVASCWRDPWLVWFFFSVSLSTKGRGRWGGDAGLLLSLFLLMEMCSLFHDKKKKLEKISRFLFSLSFSLPSLLSIHPQVQQTWWYDPACCCYFLSDFDCDSFIESEEWCQVREIDFFVLSVCLSCSSLRICWTPPPWLRPGSTSWRGSCRDPTPSSWTWSAPVIIIIIIFSPSHPPPIHSSFSHTHAKIVFTSIALIWSTLNKKVSFISIFFRMRSNHHRLQPRPDCRCLCLLLHRPLPAHRRSRTPHWGSVSFSDYYLYFSFFFPFFFSGLNVFPPSFQWNRLLLPQEDRIKCGLNASEKWGRESLMLPPEETCL